jgi:hypothetical protein
MVKLLYRMVTWLRVRRARHLLHSVTAGILERDSEHPLRRAAWGFDLRVFILRVMAVGRKDVSPKEVNIVAGKAGRISAPPEGGLYVRDAVAARARAVAERVQAYESVGVEVPGGLEALAAEVEVGEDDELINLVDAETGELLAEAEVVEVEDDGPTEEEVVDEEEPAEEFEEEAEEEAEGIDVESLTVAQLRAELDLLGVEHDAGDRKADLQQKLRAALEE